LTEFLPRTAWTRILRPDNLAQLSSLDLKGVAVHYTGSTKPLGSTATLAQSADRLQAERAMHVNDRKWSDIAYNYAIDQAGRVFELRGLTARSAANGDVPRNKAYGAVTFLIGVGDTPTPAAIDAFRHWRKEVWLPKYPYATKLVGHRDLYNTECPGDALYALLSHLADAPAPRVHPLETKAAVDDTALVKEIADELFSDAPDGAYYKVRRPDGTLCSVTVALSEIYALLAKGSA
jgi:hypothetical protein